jgi:site-specific DNA-methyltransferase (adenine-specific)
MVYPDDFIDQIICGSNIDILKTLPDESVNCCITSPPYWALRDYGVDGQLGLEPTFQEYLDKLIAIFDEVKRVLRKDGTCWVVLGDTYSGGVNSNDSKKVYGAKTLKPIKAIGFQCKSLLQIPSRFAIMMTDHGWILRNEIIWYKPNAMPSSVKDRFTVDFEKVFFFVKNKKYWFEQQLEKLIYKPHKPNNKKADLSRLDLLEDRIWGNPQGRNKRCVWQIPTKPFKEAHFAVFPPTLVVPMIKAGCPENGIVLDPFIGSGTVAEVALKLNRHFIGIELSPEYCEMAKKRIKEIQPQLVFG